MPSSDDARQNLSKEDAAENASLIGMIAIQICMYSHALFR